MRVKLYSPDCDHNCAGCASANPDGSCGASGGGIAKCEPNKSTKIKKIIGVVSGKGGVGKSFVTSLLASYLTKANKKVGILDGDIVGPSIPKVFNIHKAAYGNEDRLIVPAETYSGIKVIPGTSDVTLTAFQSLPLDSIVIVTSPQDLVSLIVKKAINMAKMMNIPILGVVENMSYVLCPKCGEKISIYGKSKLDSFAKETELKALAKLPIKEGVAELVDSGNIEQVDMNEIQPVIDEILKLLGE